VVDFSRFYQKVQAILETELPDSTSIVREGRSIAADIKIGRTAFMEKMDVRSEAEYKNQCIRDKKVMFHAHIGMSSWKSTAESLNLVYRVAQECGFVVDRAGICLDRRMGLPQHLRKSIPAETGPTLDSFEDWMQVGSVVPIQPHMGDFMIGFPASTENTVNALRAGVTTIGNLSQFFSFEVPMWHDQIATTVETVKAMAIMGALIEKGTLVHSYLEDGLGALFYDCATVAGWAYLERYIVETLLGGKLTHCNGGLTVDPVKRVGWIFALDVIHEHDCVGSMYYGDTLSFTENFNVNRGVVAEYLLWDIMAQLRCPTGHAVHPLPVTEAVRVPSAEEIAEAQVLGHRTEETARRMLPHIDFSAAYEFSDKIVSAGKRVFHNALEGLKEAGVDIRDPIQILYVLKKIGPATFEELFGEGKPDEGYARRRMPIVPTDVFEKSKGCEDQFRQFFRQPEVRRVLSDHRVLIASTDVHEHALFVMNRVLSEAGMEVVNLGPEKGPDEIVSSACMHKVDAILISTHNGMALEYAKNLKEEIHKRNATIPIVMGGVLNQKYEDNSMPLDVSGEIKDLGFQTCRSLEDLVTCARLMWPHHHSPCQ